MIGMGLFRKIFLPLGGVMAILVACGGGGGGGSSVVSGPAATGKITISGKFAAPTPTPALGGEKVFAPVLDASTVATVIVFNTNGNYTTAAVTNGSFSIPVDPGAPVAMIFAGASKNFLGYLTLGNGINSLPMTKVANGVTSIDLQTLTASGIIVTPNHNPLGSELSLTAAEQTAFAQFNSLFATVVQNPDVDGNGAIDLLEGKFYRPFVAYGTTQSSFSGAYTPTISGSLTIQFFNLSLSSMDITDNGPATVTGPAGSGLVNAACSVDMRSGQVYYNAYSNLGSSPTAIPVAGTYVFTTSKGKILTVAVPDQSAANARIVIAVPTVTVLNGKINKIDWTYRTTGNAANLSPASLIDSLIVEIDRPAGMRAYNSPNLPGSTLSHTLTDQTITWDNQTRIYMAYNDVFGNHYVVTFNNY